LAAGQALTPAEVKQPQMRALQEEYFQQLQQVGAEVQAHVFPYPFYFSRVLDVELSKQERVDQRSLRFDNYGGLTVVELTGNYFASYASETVDKSHRALRTFQDVMFPILEISVSMMQKNPDVEGFAMEISHHVRGKSMGMSIERAENLVLVLSKDAAVRLVNGKSESDRQAALLDGQMFVNGEEFILYLSDRAAQEAARMQAEPTPTPPLDAHDRKNQTVKSKGTVSTPRPPQRTSLADPPPRDTSPEALAHIQSSYQSIIDVILKELDTQAHFVSYAPPVTIPFRKQAYLELSINSTIFGSAGSRYHMAALAFDDHISHLIRPVMEYFKGDLNFDGIAFSTTIHAPQGKTVEPSGQGNEAVEFFFPVAALRCYAAYDCTGQQLIDEGAVLINGERVSLDLQVAENSAR
jgi:hypothetical protein